MSRHTSLYLDAVRFLAALVVFFDHLSAQRLTSGFLWQFQNFGDEAVIVFFVLSGYVIAYVTATREADPITYGVNRAARIYSVALPAVLTTFVLDAIGRTLQPDLYASQLSSSPSGGVAQLLTSLTFTNEVWGAQIEPGTLFAYWSLSYEVWYYLIFGLVFFLPPGRGLALAALAVVVAGPQIVSEFPIWLAGLLAYNLNSRRPVTPPVGLSLFFGSLAVWVLYEVWSWQNDHPLAHVDLWGIGHGRPVAQDYIVGFLFALNLIGFHAISGGLRAAPRWLVHAVKTAAGTTFTLYLFHEPITFFLRSLISWDPASPASRSLLVVGSLTAIFLISLATERQKDSWRGALATAVRHARRSAANGLLKDRR